MKKLLYIASLLAALLLAGCSTMLTYDDIAMIQKGMTLDELIAMTEMTPDDTLQTVFKGADMLPDSVCISEEFSVMLGTEFADAFPDLEEGSIISIYIYDMKVSESTQYSSVGGSAPGGVSCRQSSMSFHSGVPAPSFQFVSVGFSPGGMGMGYTPTAHQVSHSEPYAFIFADNKLVYWGLYYELQRELSLEIKKSSLYSGRQYGR